MQIKYLCTLNVNRDVLHPNSRDSFLAAARRWGAQYVEIVTKSPSHEHHFIQKLSMYEWFPDGARVCYLDADMVIRSDCPDLFEMVPEHELGLVRCWQPGHECGQQSIVDYWCRKHELPELDITKEWHNGGLVIFSTLFHRACLKLASDKAMEDPGICVRAWEIGDQAPLSAAAKAMDIPIRWLAPSFNRCGARLWHGWTPLMTDFIWHFCGDISKEIASRFTVWQEHGPDRYTKKGLVRWRCGAPFALNDQGQELPFLHQTLRFLPWDPVMVEVGTWLGGSLYHLIKGTDDLNAVIHCVDHWYGDPVLNPSGAELEDVYQGFLKNLKEMGSPDNVTVHRKSSIEASETFLDESLDFIYLDGSHDFDSVHRDLLAWWPKIKDGGIVSGHDYSSGNFPGVVAAVDGFFGEGKVELSKGAYAMWRIRKNGPDPFMATGLMASESASHIARVWWGSAWSRRRAASRR